MSGLTGDAVTDALDADFVDVVMTQAFGLDRMMLIHAISKIRFTHSPSGNAGRDR